jgi:hypothetical protein
MNPLLPSPMFALHRSAALSNDVEMLQTDVMRFFGIMCLCLMAIFALVKALPLAPPADRPTIAEPVDLKAAAASLKKQIAALKDKLAEAQSQLNIATAAAKQSSTQAAREAKSELDQSHHQQQEPQKNQPESPPTPAPVRKGFTLRFASDAALETLISRDNVNFYALTATKAWQLSLSGGSPAFIPVKLPPKIYEMETATVPANYVTVFHRQVAAFGQNTLTWGVTLPPPISASINHLIKDREGGDLVIMPDGEVILN